MPIAHTRLPGSSWTVSPDCQPPTHPEKYIYQWRSLAPGLQNPNFTSPRLAESPWRGSRGGPRGGSRGSRNPENLRPGVPGGLREGPRGSQGGSRGVPRLHYNYIVGVLGGVPGGPKNPGPKGCEIFGNLRPKLPVNALVFAIFGLPLFCPKLMKSRFGGGGDEFVAERLPIIKMRTLSHIGGTEKPQKNTFIKSTPTPPARGPVAGNPGNPGNPGFRRSPESRKSRKSQIPGIPQLPDSRKSPIPRFRQGPKSRNCEFPKTETSRIPESAIPRSRDL